MAATKYKLKKEDNVQIIAGKDKGKTGKVLRIDRQKGRIYVQGLNMMKKAVRARRQNEKGGIIDVEAPLDISNVMIVCKKCGPTRIGVKVEGESKTRVCRKCGGTL